MRIGPSSWQLTIWYLHICMKWTQFVWRLSPSWPHTCSTTKNPFLTDNSWIAIVVLHDTAMIIYPRRRVTTTGWIIISSYDAVIAPQETIVTIKTSSKKTLSHPLHFDISLDELCDLFHYLLPTYLHTYLPRWEVKY